MARAVCVMNPNHQEFTTTAHVCQTWVVDANGEFIRQDEDEPQVVTHPPDQDNEWRCAVCGGLVKFK
jgi:hypothetical protein